MAGMTAVAGGWVGGAVWEPRSRVGIGAGCARHLVAQHTRRGRVAILVDAHLPGAVTDPLTGAPAGGSSRFGVWAFEPGRIDLPLLAATADEIEARLGQVDTVVTVGGGSILDAAAVLRVLLADGRRPALLRALTVGRSGLVVLPAGGPGPRVCAVPTTVGTAAEVSHAAVVAVDGRRRLLNGGCLAADEVALDPEVTRTLPPPLLLAGIAEAILRTVNLFVAPPGPGWCRAADDEALDLLTALARRGASAAAGDHSDGLRLDAALLSCRSALGPWAVGRQPFAGKTWFCANELATVAGVTKMAATVVVAPQVWARLADGDRRFGQPDRLGLAWAAVLRGEPSLASSPADGLRDLVEKWELPRMGWPAGIDVADLCTRTLRYWGGGLPMLAGLDRADLHSLYADVEAESRARLASGG